MRNALLFLALLAPAACQPAAPPEPTAQARAAFPAGELIDLTYPFDAETIYWPTEDGFVLEHEFEGLTEGGYYYAANRFEAAEHGGTHLDAPIHFAEGHQTADQIPLERLLGPAVVIDVSAQAADNPDYLVSVADIEQWEAGHGALPENVIVLLRTGHGRYYPDRQRYLGTTERGPEAVAKLHFPGLDPEAARWLVANRTIKAIGIDTASIDYGQSSLFETHRVLFEQDIPAFENVANLDQLPVQDFFVIALPMKIKGGSGGPLRIVALLPGGGT